ALGVGEVADDLLDGSGQAAHQRRQSQDLVAAPQRRVVDQVDDLDVVTPREVFVADLAQVGESAHRLGCPPGDIQAQVEGFRGHLTYLCVQHACPPVGAAGQS